jgi:hypothetical protein
MSEGTAVNKLLYSLTEEESLLQSPAIASSQSGTLPLFQTMLQTRRNCWKRLVSDNAFWEFCGMIPLGPW